MLFINTLKVLQTFEPTVIDVKKCRRTSWRLVVVVVASFMSSLVSGVVNWKETKETLVRKVRSFLG